MFILIIISLALTGLEVCFLECQGAGLHTATHKSPGREQPASDRATTGRTLRTTAPGSVLGMVL